MGDVQQGHVPDADKPGDNPGPETDHDPEQSSGEAEPQAETPEPEAASETHPQPSGHPEGDAAETIRKATGEGIWLGWQLPHGSRLGFKPESANAQPVETISYGGDAHVLTTAPTGSGKGVSAVIPTLLTYPGPVIVLDIKGENWQVTARRRHEMGQQVITLDPFRLVTDDSDSLNPLDLLTLPGGDIESDALMLATQFSNGHRSLREPFWDLNASGFVSGLCIHFGTHEDPNKRTLDYVQDFLHEGDLVYNTAVLLDTNEVKNKTAVQEMTAFLEHPERETRPSVLSTVRSYFKPFNSDRVKQTVRRSSFHLHEVTENKPLSIYIVIPPEKLFSHRGLLRCWISSLMTAVLRRQKMPDVPTLFLLDEVAQLGAFDLLSSAIGLGRGYGLKCWTFWQDLAQLKSNYPEEWKTFINNSALQVFNVATRLMANDWEEVVDASTRDLRTLEQDQQLLSLPGQPETRSKRLNYLTDDAFAGLYDPHPRFSDQPASRENFKQHRKLPWDDDPEPTSEPDPPAEETEHGRNT